MIPRGSGRRVALVILAAGVVVVLVTLLSYHRAAVASGPASPATSTLTLAVPGPLNGCSSLSPQSSSSDSAVLDLLRPSAFLVGPNNVLTGEGGAFSSAELISLHPETVVYRIDPTLKWSNGRPFSVDDVVKWWQESRRLSSVNSDGYRAISRMVTNKQRTTVTAIFGTNFADWNLLFHDVEQAGTRLTCGVTQWMSRPSLGPYRVHSANSHQLVLVANAQWPNSSSHFGRVVVVTNGLLKNPSSKYFVGYEPVATKSLVDSLVMHPRVLGQFAHSNKIMELTFSPHSAPMRDRALRTALSWMLDRRQIIEQLFARFTSTPSVPTSALFSQGEENYPSSTHVPQSSALTAALIDPSSDCPSCGLALLRRAGLSHKLMGWTWKNGSVFTTSIAVGPSGLDRTVAALVKTQWSLLGINVKLVPANSDAQAALSSAKGLTDIALFERPTSTTPWTAGRSWSGAPFLDSYPSGLHSKTISELFFQAQRTFNPTTASLAWLEMDHELLSQYWIRPLFTVPALIEYSGRTSNVSSALSLSGVVDQLTNWGISNPETATTFAPTTSSIG